jgi:hypothetical protein
MFHSGNPTSPPEPPTRILGMKPWQAAFLVGFSVLDCIVLIVGITLIMRSSPPAADLAGPATAEAPTASPEILLPSYTPIDVASPSPMDTPSPENTASPEDTGLSGWVLFTINPLELWLPESYAGGDPHTQATQIVADLQAKGAPYDLTGLESYLRGTASYFVFYALDSRQGTPDVITEISIISGYVEPDEPLMDFIVRMEANLAGGFDMLEEQVVINPLYDIHKVTMVPKDPANLNSRAILYSVKNKDTVWVVMCITSADELGVREADFDKMIKTVRIHDSG